MKGVLYKRRLKRRRGEWCLVEPRVWLGDLPPPSSFFIFKSGRAVCLTSEPLDKIDYIDFPELKFNKIESTEMPFRYVKDKDGKPIMPKVSGGNV
jgi:hypothetical protein